MSCLFNSYDPYFKQPFGALRAGQTVRLTLCIPEELGYVDPHLVLQKEGKYDVPVHYRMKFDGQTPQQNHFSVELPLNDPGLYFYYFDLYTDFRRIYRTPGGEGVLSWTDGQDWQLTVYEPDFKTPDWLKNGTMYQIFPDRFCNGDHSIDPEDVVPWREHGRVKNEECFGGDLAGITSKLDYLQNLGINGLYLTPINESPSNHKYDTTDYTKIDPRFGDEETLIHLVEEAHKRGIRVMLDGVFNHCGYYFAPWQDVLEKGPESEYYDWFMINEWPFDRNGKAAKKKQIYTFAFYDGMPKINTNNPEVRKYFVDICANWVEHYGIDGIRLDVANEVSHRFCKELHARVKEINPDIYILGEIWHNALPWLRGDEFDAVMNYPLGQSIKDFWIDKSLTNEDFEYTINRCYTSYMQQTNDVLFNLLDSHDTKRLRSDVKNLDEYFAQIAVLFAMPVSYTHLTLPTTSRV